MRKMDNINKEPLTNVERTWAFDFLGGTSFIHWTQPRKNSKPQIWHVRMKYEDFIGWWKNVGCNSLFFDGASKGNPGLVGAGGVIFDSKGKKIKEYSWGIGKKTNNSVEWIALIKG